MTKEEQERCELAWKIFCEKGSVCINDPLNTENESIIDAIKRDPHVLTGAHCDFNSCDGMSYAEFVARVMAGEYDKK